MARFVVVSASTLLLTVVVNRSPFSALEALAVVLSAGLVLLSPATVVDSDKTDAVVVSLSSIVVVDDAVPTLSFDVVVVVVATSPTATTDGVASVTL
jgi:hypothetical protein